MRIAASGAAGAGGFFGGRLARRRRNVVFVGRGARLARAAGVRTPVSPSIFRSLLHSERRTGKEPA